MYLFFLVLRIRNRSAGFFAFWLDPNMEPIFSGPSVTYRVGWKVKIVQFSLFIGQFVDDSYNIGTGTQRTVSVLFWKAVKIFATLAYILLPDPDSHHRRIWDVHECLCRYRICTGPVGSPPLKCSGCHLPKDNAVDLTIWSSFQTRGNDATPGQEPLTTPSW